MKEILGFSVSEKTSKVYDKVCATHTNFDVEVENYIKICKALHAESVIISFWFDPEDSSHMWTDVRCTSEPSATFDIQYEMAGEYKPAFKTHDVQEADIQRSFLSILDHIHSMTDYDE